MFAMKLRHTAALGLLIAAGCAPVTTGPSTGWLLLVPPVTAAGNADTGQPFSKWQSIGTFPSQYECNTSMTSQQFTAHAQAGGITNAQNYYQTQALQILNARCISSGDPQLKQT